MMECLWRFCDMFYYFMVVFHGKLCVIVMNQVYQFESSVYACKGTIS